MSEKVTNTHNQHNVEKAKVFYLKALSAMSEESGVSPLGLRGVLRQHFIDEFGLEKHQSAKQIDNQIRILGANFFSVIGFEQPRSADKYEAIIKSFTSAIPQPDIDKS